MKTQTCIELNDIDSPISLKQTGKNRFTVTYGQHTAKGLDYTTAASELGACIMHALACAGRLEGLNDTETVSRETGQFRTITSDGDIKEQQRRDEKHGLYGEYEDIAN